MLANMHNPFTAATALPQGGHNVMRLTAAADDLRQRLKIASDKAAALETQLHRSQAQILRERQEAQQQITAVKAEVSTVRGSELKLRSELAQRPVVSELKANKFNDAVRTAMEADAMAARVADGEARLIELTKRSDSLSAEVTILESARSTAIDAAASDEKVLFTNEQLSEKITKLAETESNISDAETRLSVLQDDVARHEAMRESHRVDTTKAELELVTANEALVAAVGDLTVTKQERGELVLKVAGLREELEAIEAQKLEVEAAKPMEMAPMKRRMVVTGALPPNNELGFPKDTSTHRIDAMTSCGLGLPEHLSIDAPLNLCTFGAAPGEGTTQLDEMVKAVVTDLKGYLSFAADENAQRGIKPMEIEAAAVEGANA